MKVKTLFSLFLILILSLTVSAQFSSFRTISTGGVIDDEIEAILGLTEMTNIEGFNLYTNLSNFTVSEPLIDGSSPNYLIGLKGSLMDMLHLGFLSASTKYFYSDSATDEERTFMDTNADQIYDYMSKLTTNQKQSFLEDNSANYFGFLYGTKEGLKAGISYTKYVNILNSKTNAIFEAVDSNIVSNDILFTGFEEYNSNYDNKYQVDLINLAGGFATTNMEFVGAINFGFLKNDYSDFYRDTLYEDYAPQDPTINNYYKYDDYYNNYYNAPGMNIGFNLKGYYRLNEDSIEFFTGLQNNSYKPVYYFYDEYTYEEDVYPGIATDEIYTYLDSLSLLDSQTVIHISNISWAIGGKYVKKLDKALFGIGIAFSQYKNAEIDTLNYLEYYRETYDDGNGISDVNDYTYTETGSYTNEYIYNTLSTTLTIPVGIEYNFLTNLFGRLGARTYFSWSNIYQSSKYLSYSPVIGEYTYGDGSTYQYIIENPSYRNDYEVTGKGSSISTYYYYGLGWEISKNVKIDFMGFSNLTDLSTWSVSVNVKF